MRYLLILFIILCTALTTACSSTISNLKPFKLEIQQGNVVTSKMLLQLRPGMTKSQVRYIMGTPLIMDSFHINRWDYIFQLRQAGKITEQKRVILQFENDLLKTVRGDVVPAGAEAGKNVVKLTPEAEKTATKIKDAKDDKGESFTDKLKFWKAKPATDAAKTIDTDKKFDSAAAVAKPPSSSVPDAVTPAAAIVIDKTPDGSAAVTAPLADEPVSAEPAIVDKVPPQEPLLTAPSIGPAPKTINQQAPATELPVAPVKKSAKPKSAAVPSAKSDDAPLKGVPATVEPAPLPIPTTKTNDTPLSDYELKFDSKLELSHPSKEVPSSSTNSNKSEETDEAPGYFERILEKIGF